MGLKGWWVPVRRTLYPDPRASAGLTSMGIWSRGVPCLFTKAASNQQGLDPKAGKAARGRGLGPHHKGGAGAGYWAPKCGWETQSLWTAHSFRQGRGPWQPVWTSDHGQLHGHSARTGGTPRRILAPQSPLGHI